MLEAGLWFSAGLVMLVLGADGFLKGAAGIALRLGISPFVVGLTIVGFGTSAPELAVNLSAAWQGSYAMALGNVVGSNIANVGLILGLSACIVPLAVHLRLLRFEGPAMLAAAVALWMLGLDGAIGRIDALCLLGGFAFAMAMVAREARRESRKVKAELGDLAEGAQIDVAPRREWLLNAVRLLIGLLLLVYGAQRMVDAALVLARLWGWSETLIGLTVVAIGTSLPELASSLLAVRRGQVDIAVGNVVGSNLFNVLLILGATAAVHPLPVDADMRAVQLPVMIGFLAAALLAMGRKRLVTRGEGFALLAAYALFSLWQAGGIG